MSDENPRHRRASRRLQFPSPSLNPTPRGSGSGRRSHISRARALTLMSDTDHEIVHLLSEHRVVTTQQMATLLGIPERTVRYRLERLCELRLAGRSQPYAERGKAPHHWWPTRTADAYVRGEPIPTSGEREGPNESFLKHAASLTGVFVGLSRLAESLGLSLTFLREVEGKEPFTYESRETAIVPDASIVLSSQEVHYEAFIELDMGTASLTKIQRKLGIYVAYSQKGAWRERHPFLPALLFITTTDRRAEAILKAFVAKTAKDHLSWISPFEFQVYAFGICAEARRPELAFSDPVWTSGEGLDGLSFIHLVAEPARRDAERKAEIRAEEERRQEEVRKMRSDPEARRRQIHEERSAIESHEKNLQEMRVEKADLLRRLLRSTGAMSQEERRAWWFFERRIDPGREPFAKRERELSPDEEEAMEDLRRFYFEQQRKRVTSLHTRYPHLPMLVRAIKRLDTGDLLSWGGESQINESLRRDLADRKKHHGKMLDFLIWRKDEIATRKRNMGRMDRLLTSDEKIANIIDEQLLRYCRDCEAISIPSTSFDGHVYAEKKCGFCGKEDDLDRLQQAMGAGAVEPDGEGFWRVCHPAVPQWVLSKSKEDPS